jgi:hypothetical protein
VSHIDTFAHDIMGIADQEDRQWPGIVACSDMPLQTVAAAAAGRSGTAGEPEGGSKAADPTAAAAAGPSRQLDLQETFKALALRAPPGALRFAAVFTDGGCDGMREQDLTYWADHAFQPNHWNPHCRWGGGRETETAARIIVIAHTRTE